MKRSLLATSGLAGVTLMAAACGGSGGGYRASNAPPTTAGPAAATATASTVAAGNSPLGQILVDSQGRSLYLFEADTNGKSTCTWQATGWVAEWPPFIAAGTAQVGAGLAANQLGATTRADGQQHVSYHGHPLYYFAGDTQAGATSGHSLNDNGGLWYVVHTDGTPVANS